MNLPLDDQVEKIVSRDDLISFIRLLHNDLQGQPDEWENPTLACYLDALASYLEDWPGFYRNQGEPMPGQPTWKTIGELMLAARSYE